MWHCDGEFEHLFEPKTSEITSDYFHCSNPRRRQSPHGQFRFQRLLHPSLPVTDGNAEYLVRQRDTFTHRFPGLDFRGGKGESEHLGRPADAYLQKNLKNEALQSMGLKPLSTMDLLDATGARKVIEKTNRILGFRQCYDCMRLKQSIYGATFMKRRSPTPTSFLAAMSCHGQECRLRRMN